MRAASLDASFLDAELGSLLLSPLHAALKFFHVSFLGPFLKHDPNFAANFCLQLRSGTRGTASLGSLESRHLGQ